MCEFLDMDDEMARPDGLAATLTFHFIKCFPLKLLNVV